ncbi:uncharacterized protein LOC123307171 [Coccinella septempunctata]|uniref:uncharacterized protein LOC123307171 n=1 Tax=Coccinella septempunctata TaxID=41139 RepID=UPI001D095789|nr:uncharacterized protein LOC123307171 [Coccinella septempunctata]
MNMSSDPRVNVECGILEGYVCENETDPGKSYFSFQGIPYAKPPLGELRFKAPQPVEPWTGVKEVKKDGNPCYSVNPFKEGETLGSEDCLYLNVYTPTLPTMHNDGLHYDLKPVMVFIHGGAFTLGSNTKQLYGPDYLIREDVVIVAINYRLGFLGFFHLKDKKLGVTGNAGFKDMVLALRWVKNNIRNFNGDPENITIFGESAGSVSVHLLVLSPMAKGLFHKAIAQSGNALKTWAECDDVASKIAEALNLDSNDDEKLLKKLREMKVEDLHSLQESFPDPWDVSVQRLVGYVVEDLDQEEEAFLTQHPIKILESGDYNQVPLIMGYTSSEGMFMHWKGKKSFKELTPDIEHIIPRYFNLKKGTPASKRVSQKIMNYYFGTKDPDEAGIEAAYELWSDNLFIRDIYRSLKMHAETSDKPIYAYEVTVETSLNLCKKMFGITVPGVAHGDDLGYLFKSSMTGKLEPNSPEDVGVRRFCKMWTNIAKYGNPNSPTTDPLLQTSWKAFTKDEKNYLEIGQELTAKKSETLSVGGNSAHLATTMSSDARVKVESGVLEGYACENEADPGKKYFCFQGIPYAKPPVGELRFKAPQPIEPWVGIREAKEDADHCYARNMLNSKEKSGSEDCLYLNVYTPKLPVKTNNNISYDLKPVMVFIHGGAFTSGSNSKMIYGPDYLIREDVVLISINYRLGFLGFYHFKDKSLGVPGNAGLKDMVMALKWVKRNVRNFNGDPDNITIFGESAGGASVHLLVLSPMAKGLFHKAIAQSGCALNLWAEGDNITPIVAKSLNMEGADERTVLRKLRSMKVEDLFAIQESFPDPWDVSVKRFIGYVVEDPNQEEEPFLSEHPMKILERGVYNHVPLMMGYNSREGMLVHGSGKKPFKQIIPDIEKTVPNYLGIPKGSSSSKIVANKIMEHYFGDQDPDEADVDLSYKLWSDNFFIRDIYRSVSGHCRNSSKPVYLYEMTIETSLNMFKFLASIETPGVCHADDIFYLFKTPLNSDIEPGSPEDEAVRRFCKLWTNFAKRGDPNPPVRDHLLPVVWKAFRNESKNYLEIGEELVARVEPLKERMQFWEDLHIHRKAASSKL